MQVEVLGLDFWEIYLAWGQMAGACWNVDVMAGTPEVILEDDVTLRMKAMYEGWRGRKIGVGSLTTQQNPGLPLP